MSNDRAACAVLDDFRWLVGPEAAGWFDLANSLAAKQNSTLVRLAERLRAGLSPARAHLILQQRELRERGRDKFPHAQRMFFTPLGLEQATDAAVAGHKARRFPRDELIAELCCGIGGDLLALANRGPIVAVDRDPVAVLLAETNNEKTLDAAAQGKASFHAISVEEFLDQFPSVAAWHIDPDRRPSGRRTTKVTLHDPGPEILRRLLKLCPNGAIKLAPAADLLDPWWNEAELEWISRRRQCRQVVAWFGCLAKNAGKRRATVVQAGEDFSPKVTTSFVGLPYVEIPIAAKVGRFLFEPDAAVLAAKLEGCLAEQHAIAAIAPGIAYFTGDRQIDDATLDGFEILEVLPYRPRKLKQWLEARNYGRLEIKKRGVPLAPEIVRQELANDGAERATVVLTRIRGSVHAIIARRIRELF